MDPYNDPEINPFASDYYPPRTPVAAAVNSDYFVGTADVVQAIASVPPTPIQRQPEPVEIAPAISKPAQSNRTSSGSSDQFFSSGSSSQRAVPSTDQSALISELRSEIRSKDREIDEKNAKIASLRAELESFKNTTQIPNWPSFFPILHLNIAEISDLTRRRQVRLVYWLWIYTFVCYFWNFLVVTIAYLSGAYDQIRADAYVPMLYWIIIFMIAPSLSFYLWFRTIYSSSLVAGSVPTTKYWIWFINIFSHFIVTILCLSGVFFENGGIVTATKFFSMFLADDAWGFVFISTVVAWGLNTVMTALVFVFVLTWYIKSGGGHPTLKDMSFERAYLLNRGSTAPVAPED